MAQTIPYGRQDISETDIEAVVSVLRSDWLTQGPAVPAFEDAVAKHCCAARAVAVNSATSALHIACRALGLGVGDSLWTSPNTFVASANCGLYCGADIDFVDIDPRTYNLSVDALAAKLVCADAEGRLPKIVVPVHFSGQACDMAAIGALADRYGFHVIEDASHAIGGRYAEDPIGNCQHSDITVFSFHPVKIVTTGEGGVAVTNDLEIAEKMSRLRSHGITRTPDQMSGPVDGPWYYEQVDLGFNYRLTDIQAALGMSQMTRLHQFTERRRHLAGRYGDLLEGLPLVLPWQTPMAHSAWHLYVVRLQLDRIDKTRSQVFDALRASGVGVNVHYIPVHTQPLYRGMGFSEGDFPEAERYYEEALTLPLYPGLTEVQQETVVATLARALL